jgi:hypothetical protein
VLASTFVACGILGASAGDGDGDGDKEPFRRLRRRADNASSGAACLGGSVMAGLARFSMCPRGK